VLNLQPAFGRFITHSQCIDGKKKNKKTKEKKNEKKRKEMQEINRGMGPKRMRDREPRRKKPCMVPYEMIDCSVLQRSSLMDIAVRTGGMSKYS
jgi:hypothetical protein